MFIRREVLGRFAIVSWGVVCRDDLGFSRGSGGGGEERAAVRWCRRRARWVWVETESQIER